MRESIGDGEGGSIGVRRIRSSGENVQLAGIAVQVRMFNLQSSKNKRMEMNAPDFRYAGECGSSAIQKRELLHCQFVVLYKTH
ncbi:unnamed protein product [Lathyrus oleraceus]